MYLLMPAQPDIDFISLAVVFILATLLGFASHAPGSLGVFEFAMLVALPQFGKEQMLATLLLFRILYFLIPFSIAITVMGSRELWLNVMLPWQERRKANELGSEQERHKTAELGSEQERHKAAELGSEQERHKAAEFGSASAVPQPVKRRTMQG
jgi:hypothetical protein